MDDDPDTLCHALLLIKSIRGCMKRGVRHYTQQGDFLHTPEAVLKELDAGHGIIIVEPGSALEKFER